jgi:hypothetical protein
MVKGLSKKATNNFNSRKQEIQRDAKAYVKMMSAELARAKYTKATTLGEKASKIDKYGKLDVRQMPLKDRSIDFSSLDQDPFKVNPDTRRDRSDHQIEKILHYATKSPFKVRTLNAGYEDLVAQDSDDSMDREEKRQLYEEKKALEKPYHLSYHNLKKKLQNRAREEKRGKVLAELREKELSQGLEHGTLQDLFENYDIIKDERGRGIDLLSTMDVYDIVFMFDKNSYKQIKLNLEEAEAKDNQLHDKLFKNKEQQVGRKVNWKRIEQEFVLPRLNPLAEKHMEKKGERMERKYLEFIYQKIKKNAKSNEIK